MLTGGPFIPKIWGLGIWGFFWGFFWGSFGDLLGIPHPDIYMYMYPAGCLTSSGFSHDDFTSHGTPWCRAFGITFP
jgi:hypothetical protein